MTFVWDPRKARANIKKHHVDFDEAASVFLDPLATTYADPGDSSEEHREVTIAIKGHLVFVSHCERGTRIRMISARLATRAGREQYEEGIDS